MTGTGIPARDGFLPVPVLIMSGRHDECTPATAEAMRRAIPGSEWVIFEESAHFAHAEEPRRYVSTVAAFLERAERGRF